jgi:asparagine synthetase B (glutamine-hydrolysing)
MHATGISYIKNDKIVTEKLPVPANEFPFTFADYVNEDGNLYLIGHCRYSTSDLEYNQPIGNDTHSIVHNGVITQELPERWKELYNYNCETKNDSELVLHSDSPLEEFPDMSMAVCELTSDKKLLMYRNGKRPLYLSSIGNGCIITSTRDIAIRANVSSQPAEVLMNHYITFDDQLAMTIEKVTIADAVDLQHYEFC